MTRRREVSKLTIQHCQRAYKQLFQIPHPSSMSTSKPSTANIISVTSSPGTPTPAPSMLEQETWTIIPLSPASAPNNLIHTFTPKPFNYAQYSTFKTDLKSQFPLPASLSVRGSYDLEAQTALTARSSAERMVSRTLSFGKTCWDLSKWLFDDEEDI